MQLTEQREGLRLQLDEQRREASRNREHAAIAEVIAGMGHTYVLLTPSIPLDDLRLVTFSTAVGR